MRVPQPTVSVVIPTLNEERNLPHVLREVPYECELVIVDGDSKDDTVDVARALRPDARVAQEPAPGKGSALLEGFQRARGDVIIMLDADGSADPAEITRFVGALVGGADFAKGSRFLHGGGSADISPIRRLGNWGLSRLVNLLFGTRYTDLCYGYNAFWADRLPALHIEDGAGFEIETLIHLRVAMAGLRVIEVPSYESSRIHGTTNLRTFRDGWRILRLILRERLQARNGS